MKCYKCNTKMIEKDKVIVGKFTKITRICPKCGLISIEEKGEE